MKSKSLGEFEFLFNLKNSFNLEAIGDDCAIFPKDDSEDYVITSDMLVEDVDFRRDWIVPISLGDKALSISISDIAAMCGEPRFAMISLAVPEDLWDKYFLEDIYTGLTIKAKTFKTEIIGGDISKSETDLVIDTTVIGSVPKGRAVLRSGAKPGDSIFVSGFLGAAAAGFWLLESGVRLGYEGRNASPEDDWKETLAYEQLSTFPHVMPFLRDSATAMIDISDGLSGDLMHICRASEVGARIVSENIPIHPEIPRMNLGYEKELDLALHGGEDFCLLFTAPAEKKSKLISEGFHHIGEITETPEFIELIRNGESKELPPKSHQHF